MISTNIDQKMATDAQSVLIFDLAHKFLLLAIILYQVLCPRNLYPLYEYLCKMDTRLFCLFSKIVTGNLL